jgi:uncharacterized protein YciI
MPRTVSLLSALAVCLLPATALAQTSPAVQAPATAAPASPAQSTVTPMSAPMYLVIYKQGPAWKTDVPDGVQLRGHGRYMFSLHMKKALRWGGPFSDEGGAAVIDAESLEAAKALVDADPAIKDKVFVAEVHAWRHVNWDELARRFQQTPPAATPKPPSGR